MSTLLACALPQIQRRAEPGHDQDGGAKRCLALVICPIRSNQVNMALQRFIQLLGHAVLATASGPAIATLPTRPDLKCRFRLQRAALQDGHQVRTIAQDGNQVRTIAQDGNQVHAIAQDGNQVHAIVQDGHCHGLRAGGGNRGRLGRPH